MAWSDGTASTNVTWSVPSSGGISTWDTSANTEIYDILTDIDGNHIVDNQGNYISLGGGIVTGDGDSDGTWQNPSGTSVIWNVGS